MLAFCAVLAQHNTVPEPPTTAPLSTLKDTLALDVPAGARTLLISRTGSMAILNLPAGAKRVSLGINLTPKVYQDSYSVHSGGIGSNNTFSGGTGIRLHPLSTKRLSPALNVWTPLWNGTQPGNLAFSLTIGNSTSKSSSAPGVFQVQALFSHLPAEKIDDKVFMPHTRP